MILVYTDLSDESNIFDNAINKANFELTESITSFIELNESKYIFTEAEKETIVTSVKKFFTNIISAIQNFINSIKQQINRSTRFSTTDSKLHKTYKELLKQKEAGCKEVKVMDVWTLEKKYLTYVDELKKLAKKFSKMKYKRSSELNADIERFNKLYDNYDKELTSLSENTIVVPIDKMINFVEDEISNRSKVMDSLNDCITLMEQMRDDVDLIETRYDILGVDIVPKHISFLKKIGTSISSFIKKWVVKFITKVVFIVG